MAFLFLARVDPAQMSKQTPRQLQGGRAMPLHSFDKSATCRLVPNYRYGPAQPAAYVRTGNAL